jgi:anti-sigma factor RsiW
VILNLSGHLGTTVSALVDGQLSGEEEERAWRHVLTCPGCRHRVEHEAWVKQQLAVLARRPAPVSHSVLAEAAYDPEAWATVDALEQRENRRRLPLVLVGAGSVGLAVAGLMALTSAPAGRGEVPGGPRPTIQANLGDAGVPTPAPLRRTSR